MAGLGRPSVENNHAGCVFPIAWPVTVWDKVLTTGEQAMWTRSAKNKETGLMTVVCTDWNGQEFFRGEFADLAEAEKAGADAERRMTNAMMKPTDDLSDEIAAMSVDDLYAELMA